MDGLTCAFSALVSSFAHLPNALRWAELRRAFSPNSSQNMEFKKK